DLAVSMGPTNGYLSVPQGYLDILLGRGDGTFQVTTPFLAGYGPGFVEVADVNGDGKRDIITTNYAIASSRYASYSVENDIRVFPANGDGTFQAPRTYTVGYHPVSLTANRQLIVHVFPTGDRSVLAALNRQRRVPLPVGCICSCCTLVSSTFSPG